MRPLAAALFVAAFAAASPAAAQGALEIDLLEGYLATADRVPGLPHCGRHSGHVNLQGPPTPLPTGGTNAVLEEHVNWHRQHGGPLHVPSTSDDDRFGETFVLWHREFLAHFEAWRAANGHLPIPAWDPGTPMPPELAYGFPGRACSPGRNEDPQVHLPGWATPEGGEEPDPLFGHLRLCDFRDINQLGKSISVGWHLDFHGRLGGEMSSGQGPRDPAFWAGHRFLDNLFLRLGAECGTAEAAERSATAPAAVRAVPLPSHLVLGALLLAAAALRRTR